MQYLLASDSDPKVFPYASTMYVQRVKANGSYTLTASKYQARRWETRRGVESALGRVASPLPSAAKALSVVQLPSMG